ncbi:MAG: ZIP family metal transporter [Thermoanaerobaculia bacterium]
MDLYFHVLLLAAIPAGANFLGGVLAEIRPVSQKTLNLTLHGAAGVVLAVVSIELIPDALEAERAWVSLIALLVGTLAFVGLDHSLHIVQSRVSGRSVSRGAWMIFLAVAIDLFSDGIMIGTGSTLSTTLAFLLALAQAPADLPEGFATIARFRSEGMSRRNRLLLSAGFALPIFLGATIGYFGLRGAPLVARLAVLAFTAGILMTLVVEEIIPVAHDENESHFAAVIFMAGFVLFTALSLYVD